MYIYEKKHAMMKTLCNAKEIESNEIVKLLENGKPLDEKKPK